jgi:hypothetical protein
MWWLLTGLLGCPTAPVDSEPAPDTDGCSLFEDADDDGHGGAPSCEGVATGGDCDDTDPLVYPGAAELCDGEDNDCNGAIDDGSLSTWYADGDGDRFGSATAVEACSRPDGFTDNSEDCEDSDAAVNPDAAETAANGVDEDCDGVDSCWTDADGDGYGVTLVDSTDGDCADAGEAASGGDCDDGDMARSPGMTEVCADRIDQDCDGHVDCGWNGTYAIPSGEAQAHVYGTTEDDYVILGGTLGDVDSDGADEAFVVSSTKIWFVDEPVRGEMPIEAASSRSIAHGGSADDQPVIGWGFDVDGDGVGELALRRTDGTVLVVPGDTTATDVSTGAVLAFSEPAIDAGGGRRRRRRSGRSRRRGRRVGPARVQRPGDRWNRRFGCGQRRGRRAKRLVRRVRGSRGRRPGR